VDQPDIDPAAAARHLVGNAKEALGVLASEFQQSPSVWDAASIEPVLRSTAERVGLKAAALIHATRVAVTGRAVSAGLFEVLALLGRERVIARVRDAVSQAA
jgi:glutamyl-tRNA synthetase